MKKDKNLVPRSAVGKDRNIKAAEIIEGSQNPCSSCSVESAVLSSIATQTYTKI